VVAQLEAVEVVVAVVEARCLSGLVGRMVVGGWWLVRRLSVAAVVVVVEGA